MIREYKYKQFCYDANIKAKYNWNFVACVQFIRILLWTDHKCNTTCNKTYDKTYNLKVIAATTSSVLLQHFVVATTKCCLL